MNPKTIKKSLSLMLVIALMLSLIAMPGFAADETTDGSDTLVAAAPVEAPQSTNMFLNTSEDGGDNVINLTTGRSFKAIIEVDMTADEATAAIEGATVSLIYDEESAYIDPALFPYHTAGGTLDSFICGDGKTQLFSEPTITVETVGEQVCVVVTFDSVCYFFGRGGATDPSAPHSEGGAYLDVCGWFDLTVTDAEGETIGSIGGVKITPYDNFHTMKELYENIDAIVEFAAENTDIYVEKFSMGMSAGDNGLEKLDMPYLVIAKSKDAVANWKKLKAEAEADPTAVLAKLANGTIGDYQVPVLYSNVHANEVAASDAIMNFAWMLVNTAASESGVIDYNKLTGFTAAGEAELANQMGEVGAEGSVAIPDLIKDTATYLGYIKPEGSNKSGPVDLEKYYEIETVSVNIDELLDDVFFLIVPEENVEGRTYITRESSGGLDLNRDNSFQTQAETQNMTHFISEWNPVSFTEFHGRVQGFQCEPCDPPHEPNFEYDLLAEHLVTGGEALGIAAVANNDGYNSYVMPQRDYLVYTGNKTADGADETCWYDPWDDMSTSYTPQYAMLHGTVAYTVEVPAYNDDVAVGVAYGQLGQSKYIADNKADYLECQLKIFERGVTNANSNAFELVGQWFCDQYDVEGAEADVFRPIYDGEGQNGNFYPECYIIPLDGENQSNLSAAKEMVDYLERNGVTVGVTDKSFVYGDTTYPAGTAIVSMYQAKRSVANGVLYNGTVITEWPVLYSEGITAFNKTRGFDMATVAETEAYKTIAASVSSTAKISVASDKITTSQVIIKNSGEHAVAAINELLKGGNTVSMITDGEYVGSFLVSSAAYSLVSDKYILNAAAVSDKAIAPAAKEIAKSPVVYITGKPSDPTSGFVKGGVISWNAGSYNSDRQAIAMMGFDTTDNAAEADIIIGASSLDEDAIAAIKSGTPYIGYGQEWIIGENGWSIGHVATSLFADGELVWNAVSDNSMDALAYVTYPTETMTNASYIAEGDDILYGYGAGYFAKIPAGAKVLVQLDGSKDLLEGFVCSNGAHYEDFLNDSIQAISYVGKNAEGDNLNVVLFANTLTNKTHQRDEFGFIANTAFSAMTEGFKDVPMNAWYTDSVNAVADKGIMNGTSATTFEPETGVIRAEIVTTLYRMAGSPEVTATSKFEDVAADTWYTDAIAWALENGITTGTSDTTFEPEKALTREEAATFLYRFAELKELYPDTLANIREFEDVDEISDFAMTAIMWSVANHVMNGDGAGHLSPTDGAIRAELAKMLIAMSDLIAD